MILADHFKSERDLTWDYAKQCGVEHGVIKLSETDDFDELIVHIGKRFIKNSLILG